MTILGRGSRVPAWARISLLAALAAGCGAAGDGAPAVSCSVSGPGALQTLEAEMGTLLSQAASEVVDFSFAVERQDGRRYAFNRGSSTLSKVYESKSASKLVSAVIIMRLVEKGTLDLLDQPQKYIQDWPIGLSGMTLTHLLSLTSGLTQDPDCLNLGGADFEECVLSVASANAVPGNVPGQAFFYASGHLQVAGLMAVKAHGGVADWQGIFTEFRSQTGLFPASRYDSPSLSNPTLAGGMNFTGEDYMDFLRALKNGSLLNAASMGQLLADRTASIPMDFSPIADAGIGPGLGEDWHYGFGLWHECRSATFNCIPGTRVSSPGARGTYPFWDRSRGYSGIVVQEGDFGTTNTGIAIERSVETKLEVWANC